MKKWMCKDSSGIIHTVNADWIIYEGESVILKAGIFTVAVFYKPTYVIEEK